MPLISTLTHYIIKFLKGFAITFSSVVAFIALLAFIYQDKLLYINYGFKVPMLDSTPAQFGCRFKEVTIPTDDGEQLHAWLLYHDRREENHAHAEHNDNHLTERIAKLTKKNSNSIMIYFHGNAGDISGRMQNLIELYRHIDALDGILIVDYRGYGKSTGAPTEKGLMVDARSTLSYVKYELGADKVVVFGRSLGGAVSVSLMEHEETAKLVNLLILENTFTSVGGMIPHVLPKWLFFLPFFCWNKWESFRRINRIKCPVLFISGLKDEIVPSFMMKKLYDACKSPDKHLETYDDGRHNETFMQENYYQKLKSFVDTHLWKV